MRTLGDFGDQGARKLCQQRKRRENRVICVSKENKKLKGGKNLSTLGIPSNVCACAEVVMNR